MYHYYEYYTRDDYLEVEIILIDDASRIRAIGKPRPIDNIDIAEATPIVKGNRFKAQYLRGSNLPQVPCVILTIISPVLLYEAPHFRPPTINRRNFVPEGLAPYHASYNAPYRYEHPSPAPQYNRPKRNGSYHASYNAPYRYEHPSPAPQYNRPVRATPKNDMAARNEMAPARNEMMSSPRNDMSANGKRTQRAPGPAPRYAKFTLDDASAGYLNLPHGFQNPIKPSGFQPGNLFSAYKYGPAAGHLPLNSLANYYGSGSNYGVQYGSGVYGAGASYGVEGYSAHNSNRGPVIYPDSQTEKPIEEPLQEVPITPTPVSELTKAAVLHQHMFTSPSTEKPADVPVALPAQQVGPLHPFVCCPYI
ncbi:uncharacterized protein LOC103510736 [Diaphorina citri]|uniref:Uncharacterized protein LOC103510736 n=1 Tax=Diaphorina citri TaxID=121845 RepID=A0A1S3D3K4_DIACI|nr:uncharacterized protein LOC103510736 [Diaphorina citri]